MTVMARNGKEVSVDLTFPRDAWLMAQVEAAPGSPRSPVACSEDEHLRRVFGDVGVPPATYLECFRGAAEVRYFMQNG